MGNCRNRACQSHRPCHCAAATYLPRHAFRPCNFPNCYSPECAIVAARKTTCWSLHSNLHVLDDVFHSCYNLGTHVQKTCQHFITYNTEAWWKWIMHERILITIHLLHLQPGEAKTWICKAPGLQTCTLLPIWTVEQCPENQTTWSRSRDSR